MGFLSSALSSAMKPPKPLAGPKAMPKMAEGGVVKAKPGGTDVTLGEGGKDEKVTPIEGSPEEEAAETPEEEASEATPEETPEVDPRDAQLAEAQAKIELLSQVLFSMRVEGTGLLGDPSSMPYEAGMEDLDDDALTAAILALIASDPTLGKISPRGDIDQGSSSPPATPGVSLLSILKDSI